MDPEILRLILFVFTILIEPIPQGSPASPQTTFPTLETLLASMALPPEEPPTKPFVITPTPKYHEPIPFDLRSANANELGFWTSQVHIRDVDLDSRWEDPMQRRSCRRDDSWKMPVLPGFFMFGQMGLGGEETFFQNMTLAGRTGLAYQIDLGQGAQVQVRSGQAVQFNDFLRPGRTGETTDWFLEVEARYPLLAGIGLEYQGLAIPGRSSLDQDRLMQDVRVAVPVGTAGFLRLGARQQWETRPESHQWIDATQLYFGLEIKR